MAQEVKTKDTIIFNGQDKLILIIYGVTSIILGLIYYLDLQEKLSHFDIIAHFFGGASISILFLSFLKISKEKSFYLAGLVFVLWELFEISLVFVGLTIGGDFGDYLYKVAYEPLWNRIQDVFIDFLGFFVYFRCFFAPTFSTSKTPS